MYASRTSNGTDFRLYFIHSRTSLYASHTSGDVDYRYIFYSVMYLLYVPRTAAGIYFSSNLFYSCTTLYASRTSGNTDFIDSVKIALLRKIDHVINQFRNTRVHVTYFRAHIMIALLKSFLPYLLPSPIIPHGSWP